MSKRTTDSVTQVFLVFFILVLLVIFLLVESSYDNLVEDDGFPKESVELHLDDEQVDDIGGRRDAERWTPTEKEKLAKRVGEWTNRMMGNEDVN